MFNIVKTTAIAATVALIGTASAAESYFGQQYSVDGDSAIMLDLVTAENGGIVAIYDYTGGEFGTLLGTQEVMAGANPDVTISLDNNIAQEMAAVLYDTEVTDPSSAVAWIDLEVQE